MLLLPSVAFGVACFLCVNYRTVVVEQTQDCGAAPIGAASELTPVYFVVGCIWLDVMPHCPSSLILFGQNIRSKGDGDCAC